MNTYMGLDEMITRIIDEKLTSFESKILEKIHGIKDETVDIEGAMEITKLKRSTIYNLHNQGKIPCFKTGKKLLFSTVELKRWIDKGRTNLNYQ